MGKPKRGKKDRNDDWEDDIADEITSLSLKEEKLEETPNGTSEIAKPKKKDKKNKKKFLVEEEEEEEEEDNDIDEEEDFVPSKGKSKAAKMSAFQMLAGDSDDQESPLSSEDEGKASPVAEKMPAPKTAEVAPKQKAKGKKGKGKQQKDTNEDEDIDALLADIEGPKETQQPSRAKDPSEMTPDEIAAWLDGEYEEDDKKKKKKKKKEKRKQKEQEETMEVANEEAENLEEDGGKDGEEDSTIKTAAQKRKEKKERQKQQKLQEKNKQKKKSDNQAESVEKDVVVEVQEEKPESTPEPEAAGVEQEDGEESDKKKKKKDKRKKKKGEEEEEDKKKKPSKMAKAIQEMQKKLREEEERARKEEEEKERKLQELQREKEEQARKEKERKDKEKQKKKERIERLKAEGKYLTEKQKQEKKRAEQMLEALKAQGVEMPQPGEKKKKVVYEHKKKKKQTQEQKSDTTTPVETPTEEKDAEIKMKDAEPEVVEEKKDDIKDSWEDDVKDSWDAESEEEAEAQEEQPKKDDKEEEEDDDEEEDDSSEEESEEESSEESSDESSDEDDGNLTPREKALARIQRRKEEAEKNRTTDKLRAPVVCVLGHVDTGKTKILDKLRRTHVQDDEAGGITQQIGATNVPMDAIQNQTRMCKEFSKQELKVPGLLIIDTPGHESFSNLRTRGSSLCDIAILVIDIMHGLEPQTIESINLLKKGKTPFIVALNKIDRLYQWQSNPHSDVVNNLKKQKPNTKMEFEERTQGVIVQLAEQGLNACLFHENKNVREYVSLVPTSAHSGDGMGNLLALICELTQSLLAKRLAYSSDLQATVMEVKAITGLGTTIDVILVNGSIREGDTIIVAGQEGPIVTQVRALLMPQPMKELRVKNAYNKFKEVEAAQGCKIIAKDLEKALAGLPLYVAQKPDEVEVYKEEISEALEDILGSIKLTERGVFVQASTLGSLEALLEFLRTSKIPYAGINIGPVHKKDIMKASVMLEHDTQWAVILAFDVKVEREAQEMADSLGVRIFTAEIIYHLFDKFMAHREELKRQKQEEFKHIAVFPCKFKILPQFIFNSRDPIVCGIEVSAGFLKEGTPVCVPAKDFLEIGRVTSIENNHKPVPKATKGQEVCIKIEPIPGEAPKMIGRHFDETDLLVSKISRASIDAVKDYFRDEMTKADWQLIMELKKTFEIL